MDRALIIRKPWIDKILSGQKTWEMRSTKTNIRGKIGLIEAGTGLIVGEAVLTECLPAINNLLALAGFNNHRVSDFELLKKWKFPWCCHNFA